MTGLAEFAAQILAGGIEVVEDRVIPLAQLVRINDRGIEMPRSYPWLASGALDGTANILKHGNSLTVTPGWYRGTPHQQRGKDC